MNSRAAALYDVVIVGAGPAGMFAAHRLLKKGCEGKIAIIEKGKPARARNRDEPNSRINNVDIHDLVSGAGGAGLFSDGKLILSLSAGGNAGSVFTSEMEKEYVNYIESTLLYLDGYSVPYSIGNSEISVSPCPKANELMYKPYTVRHIGTENLRSVLTGFFDDIESFQNCDVFYRSEVIGAQRINNGKYAVTFRHNNEGPKTIAATYLVFAVGKEGSPWISNALEARGVRSFCNRTYIGVRIEVNSIDALPVSSGDPKLYYTFSDGTKIKTHCYCSDGEVALLKYFGKPLAGGHSPRTYKNTQCHRTGRTSFSVLLGDTPREKLNFANCIEYMEKVNELSAGKLLLQRLGDFLKNRSTTTAEIKKSSITPSTAEYVPGNIAALELPLGFNEKLAWFVKRLGKINSGLYSEDALLYAPAIEWWMKRIETNRWFETSQENLFVVGDGAGLSQGIVYSSATALVAADEIIRRLYDVDGCASNTKIQPTQ